MSTQYRLVQSGKTASGGCSAGQGSSEPVAPGIFYYYYYYYYYYYCYCYYYKPHFPFKESRLKTRKVKGEVPAPMYCTMNT
jgi:hypothetical protein